MTALIRAVEARDVKQVKALLEAGADVNQTDKSGNSPLLLAAMYGPEASVKALLEAGADVNQTDKSGNSPLLLAAMYGPEASVKALVKTLLEAGAAVDQTNKWGVAPLSLAAEFAPEAVVKQLLEAGAAVDHACDYSMTALHHAAKNGHEANIDALLKAGADVNHVDHGGDVALHYAAEYGQEASINALLKAGAGVFMNHQNKDDGDTPLHYAAENGHDAVVKQLLDAGAIVDQLNEADESPLCLAACHCDLGDDGNQAAAIALLRAGADPQKALWAAVHAGTGRMVKLLCQAGAVVDQADQDGKTLLSLAAAQGDGFAVAALLGAGAVVDRPDKWGQTPLYYADRHVDKGIVEQLLSKVSFVDTRVAWYARDTPFKVALKLGYFDIADQLIAKGEDITRISSDGETVLTFLTDRDAIYYAQTLISPFMAQFEGVLTGEKPLTKEQTIYLTSSKSYALFRMPDFFSNEALKQHLVLYYKLFLEHDALAKCKKLKTMATHAAAYLRHVLKEADLTALCKAAGIDQQQKKRLDGKLDAWAQKHFESED
jgi:ankyrin repeat protein